MRKQVSWKLGAALVFVLVSLFDSPHPAGAEGPTPIEIRIAPRDFLIANEARRMGLGYEGTSPITISSSRPSSSSTGAKGW